MTVWTRVLLALSAEVLLAQSPPTFEVASVKRSTACVDAGRSGGSREAASPDRLDMKCRTLADLIQTAYGRDAAISAGPAWMNSERYDIDAKAETPQNPETLRGTMLQALLADRFKLKVHRESQEVLVYALALGKGTPKLQPAQPGKCTPKGSPREAGLLACGLFAPSPAKDGSYMYSTTLGHFCEQLSLVMDRRVIDKTGIEGLFDIFVEAPPEQPAGAMPAGAVSI